MPSVRARVGGTDEREALTVAGRLGLVARAAVYLIVGALALLVAFGHHASTPSRQGALEAVVNRPVGRVLVVALALGFVAHVVWQVGAAVLSDGWGQRLARAGRAVVYAGFVATTIPFVLHGRAHHGSKRHEVDFTARVLQWPGGRALVILAGLAIVGSGVWQGYRGLSQRYRKKLRWAEMDDRVERAVPVIATGGYVGRMLAYLLVGLLVAGAGLYHRPQDAGGLDVALYRAMRHPLGPVAVVAVGIGLALFGCYSLIEARYRKLP